MPEPREYDVDANGTRLHVAEWAGRDPAFLLCHATSFHRRCWDEVVARLGGRHCYAMDQRGHGLSAKPEPPYTWAGLSEDVAAVARELGLRGAIGCGHSGGGHFIARAAAREPGVFAALLLVDPTIFQRDWAPPWGEEAHPSSRRRNQWSSPDEMYESFRVRKPFDIWDPAVLRDYCDHALVPNPDGEGYILACPPRIEAASYALADRNGAVWDDLERLDIPVRVLRVTPRTGETRDMSTSPCDPEVVEHLRHGTDVFVPQYTHFLAMEDPGFIAKHLLELSPG